MVTTSVRNQYLATICVNLCAISYGTSCGWTSSINLLLQSDDSPLTSGPISIEEMALIVSFLCIGGLFGNLLYGWLSNNYGRRILLITISFPQIASWLIIRFAENPLQLYVARFLCGFSGGASFVLIPIFIAEISDDNIRGTLGSLLVLSCNIGVLFSFIIASFMNYATIAYVSITIPILFLSTFTLLPETPEYLLKINKEKEAINSLKFYRYNKYHTTSINSHIEKFKIRLKEGDSDESNTNITISDFTTPNAKHAFLIGFILMALNQFCGCFAMLNYTASIFADAGSNLSPNTSAIIVGIIQLVGSYVATTLVDKKGRKFLLGISSMGIFIGLSILGIYSYLKIHYTFMESYKWISILSFSFVMLIASFGVLTLPFVVLAEIIPQKIRPIGTSICMSLIWIFGTIMLFSFPLLSELLGMHGTMFLFAGCSLMGSIFVIFFMPETKGKSFEEIEKMLEK